MKKSEVSQKHRKGRKEGRQGGREEIETEKGEKRGKGEREIASEGHIHVLAGSN